VSPGYANPHRTYPICARQCREKSVSIGKKGGSAVIRVQKGKLEKKKKKKEKKEKTYQQ
jgi:hypothetical protein